MCQPGSVGACDCLRGKLPKNLLKTYFSLSSTKKKNWLPLCYPVGRAARQPVYVNCNQETVKSFNCLGTGSPSLPLAWAHLERVEMASSQRQEVRFTPQCGHVSADEFGSQQEAQRGDMTRPRSYNCLGFEPTAGSHIGHTLRDCWAVCA